MNLEKIKKYIKLDLDLDNDIEMLEAIQYYLMVNCKNIKNSIKKKICGLLSSKSDPKESCVDILYHINYLLKTGALKKKFPDMPKSKLDHRVAFKLQVNNYVLVKLFCHTKDKAYLDMMDPKLVRYFDDIIDKNIKKLTKNDIAKIVKKYVQKRIKEELETVDNVIDMDYLQYGILPNVLPNVLETLLSSMLEVKKYTKKQMIIYKYAVSIYGKRKRKSESESEEESDEGVKWDLTFAGDESDESDKSDKKHKSALEKACVLVKGLNFTGNSCYMDSVLLCLFAIPNKTITENILDKNLDEIKELTNLDVQCDKKNIENDIKRRKAVQKELNSITNSMRKLDDKVETCSNLRGLLGRCVLPQRFNTTDMQDAGEFLTYLFNMFQVQIMIERKKFYGTNDKGKDPKWTYVRKQKNIHYPIIIISASAIREMLSGYDISSFASGKIEDITLFTKDNMWKPGPNMNFRIKKEVTTVESSLIIFRLERKDKRKILKNTVYIPETIQSGKNTLHLSAMVVHDGYAHYTANFKCQGNWFFYDDNRANSVRSTNKPGPNTSKSQHKIKYIGSYEKMLKNSENDPRKLGTLFFYT